MAAIFYNLTPLFAAILSAAVIGEKPQAFHAVAFGPDRGGSSSLVGRPPLTPHKALKNPPGKPKNVMNRARRAAIQAAANASDQDPACATIQPVTGRELLLEPNVVIISRTGCRGRITFANDDFLRTSGFSLDELIGENHNILRHPDMPAEAFRDLWATLRRGRPWSGLVRTAAKRRPLLGARVGDGQRRRRLHVGAGAPRARRSGGAGPYGRMRSDPALRLHEGPARPARRRPAWSNAWRPPPTGCPSAGACCW